MLNLLKISGKEDVIKLYNCKEPHEAVLLFEKEFLKKSVSTRMTSKEDALKGLTHLYKYSLKAAPLIMMRLLIW